MQPQGSIGPGHHNVTSDDGGHQPISTKHRKRECMSCNTRTHWWHTLLCNSAWGSMSAKRWVVLNMELTILTLIRSFREGNFTLYRESLSELIPYFFANNNINYARWLPIHLRDMICLEKQHPDVAREFHQGNFVVHKYDRNFSAMAIDEPHEQNNAVIKGDGGAIGVTEDPSALRRWMVAGPEISRLVTNYEKYQEPKMQRKAIVTMNKQRQFRGHSLRKSNSSQW